MDEQTKLKAYQNYDMTIFRNIRYFDSMVQDLCTELPKGLGFDQSFEQCRELASELRNLILSTDDIIDVISYYVILLQKIILSTNTFRKLQIVIDQENISDFYCYCLGRVTSWSGLFQISLLLLLRAERPGSNIFLYDPDHTLIDDIYLNNVFHNFSKTGKLIFLSNAVDFKYIDKKSLVYMPCCNTEVAQELIENINENIIVLSNAAVFAKNVEYVEIKEDLKKVTDKKKVGELRTIGAISKLCIRFIYFYEKDPRLRQFKLENLWGLFGGFSFGKKNRKSRRIKRKSINKTRKSYRKLPC